MSLISGEEAIVKGVNFWSVCTSLFSLDFLNQHNIRFANGIISQDSEFNMKVYPFAERVIFTDIISYYYFDNITSATKSKDLKKVLKKVKSLIYIANSTKQVATQLKSPILRNNYIQRSNSIIVGLLRVLIKNSYSLSVDNKREIFEIIKENKLFPIKGGTLSWKSSLLLPILNREMVIKRMMKI